MKPVSFKVDPTLWAAFQRTAASRDRTASQELREYMRQYVAQHGQADLYSKKKGK